MPTGAIHDTWDTRADLSVRRPECACGARLMTTPPPMRHPETGAPCCGPCFRAASNPSPKQPEPPMPSPALQPPPAPPADRDGAPLAPLSASPESPVVPVAAGGGASRRGCLWPECTARHAAKGYCFSHYDWTKRLGLQAVAWFSNGKAPAHDVVASLPKRQAEYLAANPTSAARVQAGKASQAKARAKAKGLAVAPPSSARVAEMEERLATLERDLSACRDALPHGADQMPPQMFTPGSLAHAIACEMRDYAAVRADRDRGQGRWVEAETQLEEAHTALTAAGVTPTGTLAERIGALAKDVAELRDDVARALGYADGAGTTSDDDLVDELTRRLDVVAVLDEDNILRRAEAVKRKRALLAEIAHLDAVIRGEAA